MAFEIVGKLHKKFDTEQKTASFQAREFVIETDGNYPQFVKFQCTQDKCSMVDGVEEGQTIKVYFDLRGREWNGKYFTNLNAWKIDANASANVATTPDEDYDMNQDRTPSASNAAPAPAPAKPMETSSSSEEYDDLPF